MNNNPSNIKESINEAGEHPKQEFQVERLAFFSDAIFAIAITLLIIEFKVPHITKESTFENAWEQLAELKYQFLSLLLSFVLIAVYWIRHHSLFKHIHNYNRAVIIANMFVLLPVIFFPFTTAFMAESLENANVIILAVRLFLINHIAAALTSYFFYWLAVVRHKEFAFEMSANEKDTFTTETMFSAIVYIITLLMTFLVPDNIKFTYWTIITCYFFKKLYDSFRRKKAIKAT